jgi:hypothetical protein
MRGADIVEGEQTGLVLHQIGLEANRHALPPGGKHKQAGARRIQATPQPTESTNATPTTPDPEPLRVSTLFNRLPWDLAKDQFGSKGADFIALTGGLLRRRALKTSPSAMLLSQKEF